MKIAFFVNEFPVISETFVLNQIVGLIRRGHEVDIYARWLNASGNSDRHSDVERFNLLDRARFYPTPERRIARLASAVRRSARWGWRRPYITLDSLNVLRYGRSALNLTLLHEVLPALDSPRTYDVIHCHYGPNGRQAVAWRFFGALRGPIITTFHGYDVNKLPRIEGPQLYRQLFDEGELFTVGSEFLEERVVKLGAPPDRIVKLPMGIDLFRFPFVEHRKKPDDELRLLTVARLVEVKGIEYALRAVSSLRCKNSRILYQIVGDGPLRGELEELVDRLRLTDRVEFLGALPQEFLGELYRGAHIFLLPSVVTSAGEEETQSLVLAEAQASGLPVIATRIGGIPESMREGESGLLVRPRDPGALAHAIEQLAQRPETWGQMGRIGRAHVESRFDLEKLNDQLVDLYHRVAAPN
jgi:colanic acid/amylovoran biosynthesis glycosyltransferase